MPKLILHIGQHKTGSTALQHALAGQRRNLLRNGICYPRLPGWRFAHHALFPHFFGVERCDPYVLRRLGPNREAAITASKTAWDTCCAELSKQAAQTVLLSSETFFTCADADSMRRLGDVFRQVFDEIELICYLRHPADFILSSLSTQLQLDADFRWPEPDVRRLVLESYSQIQPGKVHVVSYSRESLIGGDVLADFSERLLPVECRLRESKKVNSSMSPEAMAVMEAFVAGNGATRDRAMSLQQQFFRRVLRQVDRMVGGNTAPELIPSFRESVVMGCTDLEWLKAQHRIDWTPARGSAVHPASSVDYGARLTVSDACRVDPGRLARLQRLMGVVSAVTRPFGD